jgi:hypothetical protein
MPASDDSLIPSDTAGISLHLRREKQPARVERFSAQTTVSSDAWRDFLFCQLV